MNDAQLLERALDAREQAYAPYSRFRVGAAVLTRDGRVYGGCNVENASYGLCNCAERTALFAAVADGHRPGDLERLLVVADTEQPVQPCGACRQVMLELGGEHLRVVLADCHGSRIETTAGQLLPGGFRLPTDDSRPHADD
jgi:cytidine deaminase